MAYCNAYYKFDSYSFETASDNFILLIDKLTFGLITFNTQILFYEELAVESRTIYQEQATFYK